jgi:hypothetical protein
MGVATCRADHRLGMSQPAANANVVTGRSHLRHEQPAGEKHLRGVEGCTCNAQRDAREPGDEQPGRFGWRRQCSSDRFTPSVVNGS